MEKVGGMLGSQSMQAKGTEKRDAAGAYDQGSSGGYGQDQGNSGSNY